MSLRGRINKDGVLPLDIINNGTINKLLYIRGFNFKLYKDEKCNKMYEKCIKVLHKGLCKSDVISLQHLSLTSTDVREVQRALTLLFGVKPYKEIKTSINTETGK